MFPLKWAPETHNLVRFGVPIRYADVPAVARPQTRRFIETLGPDVVWVVQPLEHTLSHFRFRGEDYDGLVACRLSDCCDGFDPQGWRAALETLASTYSDIPAVLWDTLGVMGLRPNPEQEEAIPNIGNILRHPWSVSDAALHAAAKSTALWGDICHVLERTSGRYPEHGCGCSHILRALPRGASFPPLPADRRQHVTRE